MSLNEASGCARDETLALFLEGGLEGAEQARVEEHLGHCDTCLALIAAAAQTFDATREPARAEQVAPPRFERGAFLARGGMGAVFEGLDRHTGQRVAIKRIQPDIADAPEFVDRFEREAEILRRLDHPNIVRLLALELVGDERQIVMEYVAGGSLRDLLRREGRLSADRALALALELSDALARVHHLAIIHRDIKPENILLAKDGTPKLSDFGLSRMGPRSLTRTGTVQGTIAYQCPEVLAGGEADARSDVWALGVVLFEMLSGRRPFEAQHPAALVTAILQLPLPDLGALCPQAPPGLLELLARMLTKGPQHRIQSMRQIGAELEAIAAGSGERPLAPPRASAPADSELVGRAGELGRLQQLLANANLGAGRVILVTGEAGSGKTALCDVWLGTVRRHGLRWQIGTGHCLEHLGPSEAYSPFLHALGALLESDGDGHFAAALELHAPSWCLQFPARFGSERQLAQLQRSALGVTPERMQRELCDALSTFARVSPLLLRLEDLHWADPASIDLLRLLARRAKETRLLLLATLRSDALAHDDQPVSVLHRELLAHDLCEELSLAPLSALDLESYLGRVYQPNDFALELAQFVLKRTEGHALFATRLVRHLAERGAIVSTSEGFRLGAAPQQVALAVPESVSALLRGKLASLSEAEQQLLSHASVEGEEFSSAVLARLLDVDALGIEESLRPLARLHRLVQPLGETLLRNGELTLRYRFAHALYRDVLYADLPIRHKRSLHLRVAAALLEQQGDQARDSAARIAAHLESGGDARQAIQYWLEAADKDTRAYAFREAAASYTHALQLSEVLPPVEQPRLAARIHRKRAWAMFRLTQVPEAIREFERALGLARELGDAALEGELLNTLSHLSIYTHVAGDMEAWATQALQVALASGNEGVGLVARAHLAGGRLWGEPGTEDALEPVIARARILRHEPSLALGLALQGVVYYFRGKYELALRCLSEALRYPTDLREPPFTITCLRLIASAHAHLGRIDAALAGYAESLELSRLNAFEQGTLHGHAELFWLHREIGDLPAAAIHLEQSGLRQLNIPEHARGPRVVNAISALYGLFEAETQRVLCFAPRFARAPASAEAEAAYEVASAWRRRVDWWHFRLRLRLDTYRAQRALLAADYGTAREVATAVLELATKYGARQQQAIARRILAEVAAEHGEWQQAAAQLERALGEIEEFPIPLIAWKLQASLGRVQQQLKAPVAAQAAFDRARRMVDHVAQRIGDARRQETFLATSHRLVVESGAEWTAGVATS